MAKNKRVLLVEQSDATRKVAESLLRQNGYEVISVSSSDKALEVVEFTRPDLMVVGGDLTSSGNKPLYDRLQNEPRSSSVPLIVIDSDAGGELPLPGEVVVTPPLDSKDFIAKVNAFVSSEPEVTNASAAANPLADGDLEDDLIDSALGIDQIEVTDSEVMDKTAIPKGAHAKRAESDRIGLDDNVEDAGDESFTGKIDTISIDEDTTDIVQKNQRKPSQAPDTSGKLEILSDQFGIASDAGLDLGEVDQDHDYHWFINEMRSDSMNPDKGFKSGRDKSFESADLQIKDTSAYVDPVTPPPATPSAPTSKNEKGVDHFIEEFKKEVEKIQTEPEMELSDGQRRADSDKVADMVWEDKLENLTVDQLGIFTRRFSQDLAGRIAELIVNKLDADKLLAMIKAEVISRAKNRQ